MGLFYSIWKIMKIIFGCTKGEIYPIENYDIPIGRTKLKP